MHGQWLFQSTGSGWQSYTSIKIVDDLRECSTYSLNITYSLILELDIILVWNQMSKRKRKREACCDYCSSCSTLWGPSQSLLSFSESKEEVNKERESFFVGVIW